MWNMGWEWVVVKQEINSFDQSDEDALVYIKEATV